MKKLFKSGICLLLALIIFSAQSMAFATNAKALNYTEGIKAVAEFDESEIYDAFTEVDNLVFYLQENEGVTYNELKSDNSELIANLSSTSALAFSSSDTPPIFSAFVWGCLLNWVGMLIVGLTTDFDNQQIMKSAWGCLINTLLFGGGYWFSVY
jgi:hypothetical protein